MRRIGAPGTKLREIHAPADLCVCKYSHALAERGRVKAAMFNMFGSQLLHLRAGVVPNPGTIHEPMLYILRLHPRNSIRIRVFTFTCARCPQSRNHTRLIDADETTAAPTPSRLVAPSAAPAAPAHFFNLGHMSCVRNTAVCRMNEQCIGFAELRHTKRGGAVCHLVKKVSSGASSATDTRNVGSHCQHLCRWCGSHGR
jgi:hypothetical protein